MTKPAFGFAALQEIRPEPPPPAPVPAAKVDRAAERRGFTSREPVTRRRRARPDEQSDQFNIRAPIPAINAFVEWCERERYTYGEGFAHLVERLKV